MSDTRFTMLGIVLIFVGFIVLGVLGSQYYDVAVEAEEFGTCYEYFDDRDPVPMDCDIKMQDRMLFFALVVGFIGAGIATLIKGTRGTWDQDVKPEDMVGPGRPTGSQPDDSDDKSESGNDKN